MKKKLEIVSSVNSLNEKKWNLKFENVNPFLLTNFLKIFEKNNSVNSVIPVYITTKNGNVYGHLIKIDGSKIANYLTANQMNQEPTNHQVALKAAELINAIVSSDEKNVFAINLILENHIKIYRR